MRVAGLAIRLRLVSFALKSKPSSPVPALLAGYALAVNILASLALESKLTIPLVSKQAKHGGSTTGGIQERQERERVSSRRFSVRHTGFWRMVFWHPGYRYGAISRYGVFLR